MGYISKWVPHTNLNGGIERNNIGTEHTLMVSTNIHQNITQNEYYVYIELHTQP